MRWMIAPADEAEKEPSMDELAVDVEPLAIESATGVDGEAGDADEVVEDQITYAKRKTFKSVNQFSCCDRATQTTVAAVRVS